MATKAKTTTKAKRNPGAKDAVRSRRSSSNQAAPQAIDPLDAVSSNPLTDAIAANIQRGFGLDAFRNVAARMGDGTPSLGEFTEYAMERWSQDWFLLNTLYRNHWLSRQIVDIPAHAMTSRWARLVSSDLKPEDIDRVNRAIARTQTPARVRKALKRARLYGGAGALIVIEGDEQLDQPVDLANIGPGAYKGLIIFDKWSGIQPTNDICLDVDRPIDYGLPEFYMVQPNEGAAFKVHCSRILRFTGPDVPSPEFETTSRWGISVLELVFDEVKQADNMKWSIAQLMFRAQLLTLVNPALAAQQGVGAGGVANQNFQGSMAQMNQLMSNQSLILLPKDGKMESHQYTFGGVADVIREKRLDISGAANIPIVRLFGKIGAGLGDSGEAEERVWEEHIADSQQDELKPQLEKLYPIVCMSELGEVPADMDLHFPSIRVLTEKDKADLAKSGAEAVMAPYNGQLYGQRTALQELRNMSDSIGIFSTITDEMIANASDDVIPLGEMQGAQLTQLETETAAGGEGETDEKDEPDGAK